MELSRFLLDAGGVRPSARQIRWFDTEMYAFVHFTVNTYTGREWGLGDEDEAIFDPVELDCDQWVEAVKAAGCRGLVLTAKHHDGFCLWPTRTTEHCVRRSPFRAGEGDIVREAAEACRRGGIKFGFYLSPWDRNCALYGTPEYNDFYKAQLTELLTGYGDIFLVWFDGACGEGPNGRRQEYDFPGYVDLVRRYQPEACVFYDRGPDVRWCGNEAGRARQAEWAVVPQELCPLAEKQADGPGLGDISGVYNDRPDLGSLANIAGAKGLVFCPSEVDMSIRPGWFYHPEEEPHSLERLFHTYLAAVGGNACFHLNVPPMPNGRFDERDVRRLRELGEKVRSEFARPIDARIAREGNEIVLRFGEKTRVRYVVLEEEIARGQRVETFSILWRNDASERYDVARHGFTIGHKRICPVDVETDEIRVRVTMSRGEALLRQPRAYR